jgi:tetratricopeptide (TPR) repeat protein
MAALFEPGQAAPSDDDPRMMNGAFRDGMRAKWAGDYPAALAAFARVAREPHPAPAALVAGQQAETLILSGRFDEAEAAIAAAATGTAAHAVLAGLLAQARGLHDEARAAFERARAAAAAHPARPGTADEARAACHLAELALLDGSARYAQYLFAEYVPRLSAAPVLADWAGHFTGMTGLTTIALGQLGEGHAALRRALVMAEDIGDVRHVRRWSLTLGEIALNDGRFSDADAHLERALRQPGPVSASADEAALWLLVSERHRTTNAFAEAIETAEKAVAAAADPLSRARGEGVRGLALHADGQIAEAIAALRAAVAVLGPAPAHLLDVEIGRGLGAVLLAAGARTEAIAHLRTLYERVHAQAGRTADAAPASLCTPPAIPGVRWALAAARVQRDLGTAHRAAGEVKAALESWRAAAALFEAEGDYAQAARVLAEMTPITWVASRSQRECRAALQMLNKIGRDDTETRGRVLSNAALVYAETGDIDSADSFFSEALAMAERTRDAVAESIRAGNYGCFLLMTGRSRRAIASLERALRLSTPRPALALYTAVQTANLAMAYDALSDYPAALAQHRAAAALLAQMPAGSEGVRYWRARVGLQTAHTLLRLRDADAPAVLAGALADVRAVPAEEAGDLLVRALTAEAAFALADGDFERARAAADRAAGLARTAGLGALLADALSARAEAEARLGDTDRATATWHEAEREYAVLHMPGARLKPAWKAETQPPGRA